MNDLHFREVRDKDGFITRINVHYRGSRAGSLVSTKGTIMRDGSSRGGWSVKIPGHYDDGCCLLNDLDGVKAIIARDWAKSGHIIKGSKNGAIIGAKEKGEQGGAPESKKSTTNAKGGSKMKKQIRIVKTVGVRELTLTYNKVPVAKVSHDPKKGWQIDTKFRNLLKKFKVDTEAGYKKRGAIHEIVDNLNARGILEAELEKMTASTAPAKGKEKTKKG